MISSDAACAVELVVAGPSDKAALANLAQLYIHDFSEFWAGRPGGELGDDGRFTPMTDFDDYWREAGRIPLLVRAGGALA
ncbi:MAG TPA: hypothetical protein VIJ59_01855, partial [Caulobacteraceae bacterium]